MADIRHATPADCRRIAEIQTDGWKAAYRGILPDDYLDGLQSEPRIAVWERFVRSEPGEMFVAAADGGIAGFCHLIPSRDPDAGRTAEIAAIYVDPGRWKKGHGSALCRAAIASAGQQGFDHLTLWVLEGNAAGRRFYERMGLRPDGARKSEERPGFVLEEVRYRIELPPQDAAQA